MAGPTTPSGGNIWAPEFHLLNGQLVPLLHRRAGHADNLRHPAHPRAGERGPDPMGPYTFKDLLDPHQRTTWELDASILAQRQAVPAGHHVRQRHADPVHPADEQPVDAPAAPAASSPARPTLGDGRRRGQRGRRGLQRNGRTFIVYSASHCSTPDYKLGMLTYNGGDPLDSSSWVKSPNPVFQRYNANGVYGPGHNGFFKSPDGTEDWIVYHANASASGGCDINRTTRAQKFTWNADGTPNFGTPVALGVTLTAPSGETAATPTAYMLVNRHSGKCLDVSGGNIADGTNVFQWTCSGGANQKWRIEDLGDDTSRLINVATGKVLDIADCSTADGADLRQWSWLNNACQRFRLVSTTSGDCVRMVDANSGKVADVADCSTADGADVRQGRG